MNKDKIEPKIKEKLFSTDTAIAVSAVKLLKEKGNHLYLPMLFELLNSNPEIELETEIMALLSTIKDKQSTLSFVEAIENPALKPILKKILTTSWQNGLDFSPYVKILVTIIINENWEIAFEAFTIIDNFETMPSDDVIDETLSVIDAALPEMDEQKAYFLREIKKQLT